MRLLDLREASTRYFQREEPDASPAAFFQQGVALCDRLAKTQTVPEFLSVAAALLCALLATAPALDLEETKRLAIRSNHTPEDWRSQVGACKDWLSMPASPGALANAFARYWEALACRGVWQQQVRLVAARNLAKQAVH